MDSKAPCASACPRFECRLRCRDHYARRPAVDRRRRFDRADRSVQEAPGGPCRGAGGGWPTRQPHHSGRRGAGPDSRQRHQPRLSPPPRSNGRRNVGGGAAPGGGPGAAWGGGGLGRGGGAPPAGGWGGLGLGGGDTDDSPRIRISRAEDHSRRARLARAIRRRGQAAGRRPQPVADDEAALRPARSPDRSRQDRRAKGHTRGRRHAAHRRDDHRERTHLVEAAAGQVSLAGRGRTAHLRSAGALQGHDRRRHLARRPRQRSSGADAGARRVVRADGARAASASSRRTAFSSAPTTR